MAKNYKVQVVVSEELKETLEKLSKKTGASISGMCNMWISQGSLAYSMCLDKASTMIDKYMDEINEERE